MRSKTGYIMPRQRLIIISKLSSTNKNNMLRGVSMSHKEYYVHMKNKQNTGGGEGQKGIC